MPHNVTSKCEDIASQLVHSITGKNLNVILGGGRREFLSENITDEENSIGKRKDERNLIHEWSTTRGTNKVQYVWNRNDLNNVQADTEYLLGLFESNHCRYHLDAADEDPSLLEMTEAAIKILSKGSDGYFLFVEGGRIDHAHHDTQAQKALDEAVELSKAVQRARELTSREDTLIIVTSDHAHTMTVSGYSERGNDIFGVAGKGDDELPYTTLSYANGPSYRKEVNGSRYNVSDDDRSKCTTIRLFSRI